MHITVGAGHWRGNATEQSQSTIIETWTWQHDKKKMLSLRQSSKVMQFVVGGTGQTKRFQSGLWSDGANGKALSKEKDGSEQPNRLK